MPAPRSEMREAPGGKRIDQKPPPQVDVDLAGRQLQHGALPLVSCDRGVDAGGVLRRLARIIGHHREGRPGEVNEDRHGRTLRNPPVAEQVFTYQV